MTKGTKTTGRETVYDRCAYVGCFNGKFINGRQLFHFPAETDRRLEMWIERSGNFRLRTWAATSLRKAGLCGDHFDEKSFTNATRKTLRRNVVPRHYMEELKCKYTSVENRGNEKGATGSEDEDDPMNCDRSSSRLVEFTTVQQHCPNDIRDESSLESDDHRLEESVRKAPRVRSPSPVVEFIVEELDESLISDRSQSPKRNTVLKEAEEGDEEEEGEEEEKEEEEEVKVEGVKVEEVKVEEVKVEEVKVEEVGEEEKEEEEEVEEEDNNGVNERTTVSPMIFEAMDEIIKPVTDENERLTVSKSNWDGRSYYRSKNHHLINFEELDRHNVELRSEENERIAYDENNTITRTTKQTCCANGAECSNKSHGTTLLNLRNENKQLRKTMRLLQQNLRRSKAREAHCTRARHTLKNIDEFLNVQECTNPAVRAMIKLTLHRPKTPYTKEEKDFAIQFYKSSPVAFVKLRTDGCNFPGRSTMKRWIAEENEPTCDFVQRNADCVVEACDGFNEMDDDFDVADDDFDVADDNFDGTVDDYDIVDDDFDEMNGNIEAHDNFVGASVEIDDQVGYMPDSIVGMNVAVENAEVVIDGFVDQLEVRIEDVMGHEEYMEALPPDDFK